MIALARPPVNAIELSLVGAIRESLKRASTSAACRAVVLTGAPPAFSAGVDVKVVPAYDAPTRAEMIRAVNAMALELYGMPKPTVAAINGHALGGGLVLALGCDFRLAAAGAHRLGLTEITAGIPFPAAPMVVVRSELDHGVARKMVLGGVTFGPTDPLAASFLDAVHPPEDLLRAAIDRAESAAAATAYAAVKAQARADALARMRAIVDENTDPMTRGW